MANKIAFIDDFFTSIKIKVDVLVETILSNKKLDQEQISSLNSDRQIIISEIEKLEKKQFLT